MLHPHAEIITSEVALGSAHPDFASTVPLPYFYVRCLPCLCKDCNIVSTYLAGRGELAAGAPCSPGLPCIPPPPTGSAQSTLLRCQPPWILVRSYWSRAVSSVPGPEYV
jgi:hypothetical protein